MRFNGKNNIVCSVCVDLRERFGKMSVARAGHDNSTVLLRVLDVEIFDIILEQGLYLDGIFV